jgi:hypothetical protein
VVVSFWTRCVPIFGYGDGFVFVLDRVGESVPVPGAGEAARGLTSTGDSERDSADTLVRADGWKA